MSRPAFASGFAAELDAYIDMKVACGFKERSFAGVLAKFDRFCAARGIDGVAFTRDDADEWERRLPGEATTTFYARVNKSKGFLDHLVAKGVPGVRPVRDVPFRPTAFRPHIYTDGEVASYFREADAWSTPRSWPDEVQFPVLFRTLYCCGSCRRRCPTTGDRGSASQRRRRNRRARPRCRNGCRRRQCAARAGCRDARCMR